MPIITDLTRNPYFDDYNDKDNYHRILFKPAVAVQVRELNQLQTILQNQVERFGDNIYKRGTIIDGCNFIFHNNLPFIKINDTQTDGAPVNVSSFKGFFVKNSNNVIAQIVETATGFESSDPDLNTLHLKYISSGNDSSTSSFFPDQIVTIYNPSMVVSEADVIVKSQGFSNNDNLVILSAIEVSNTVGGDEFANTSGQACTFAVGEVITQSLTGAQAQITEVNATANVDTLILKIKPLASNLKLGNTISWLFAENYEFTSNTSQITAKVQKNIGKDAYGVIVTDSIGGVKHVSIFNGGTGYYIEPHLTVAYSQANTSLSADAAINLLQITSKNYLCNVTINDSITSVGTGIGIAVTDGIIYQKGHFVRVNEQFIVVDKYNNQTNNVVGFDTVEEIITFRQDQNLLDNASGTYNIKAPGADRLKLTPKLVSLAKEQADANNLFLPLIEYSLGKPAKQRKTTQFNSIAKELAQRTYEQSGNYVLDQFLISTEENDDPTIGALSYRVKADPGTAYIDGYRVQTYASVTTDASKSSKTTTQSSSISINYGNYIRISETAGFFNFATGDLISLRDTTSKYLTLQMNETVNQFNTISAAGSEIGVAKIRSMQIEEGLHGSPDATYKLYLFDIKMNPGKNFKQVKSIFYDGNGINGIADINLSYPDNIKNLSTAEISAVEIINGGSGYANGTSAVFTTAPGAKGTGAAATITTDGSGIVTSFTFTNRGLGYTKPPVIYVSGGTGGLFSAILSTDKHQISNLYESKQSSLLFPSGSHALKQINSISYTYRTNKKDVTLNANGTIKVSVAANPGEYFDYTSLLTDNEKRSLMLVPLSTCEATINAIGQVTVTSGNGMSNVVGVGETTNFLSDYKVGDYIKIGNNSSYQTKRITKITNATHLVVQNSLNLEYNVADGANTKLVFPKHVPIKMGESKRTANVQSNTTLNLYIGNSITSSATVALAYDVRRIVDSVPKSIIRNTYALINPMDNVGGIIGPWSLGFPDILRLKSVYEGKTIEVANTDINLTTDFISITNNNLVNQDKVVYASLSPAEPLANGVYYVNSANSSGIKLSATSTGNPINITANAQSLSYIMSVSNTDTNVTQNYYIDHNQRKDYYDIGYLYKNASYSVPSNKLLLVEFDVLRTNQNGIKTISSYPVNDFIKLEDNTTGIHTLEIPELIHDNGEYFDLIDTLDFRPYSSNTINVAIDYKKAPYNPTELDSSERFDFTIDKKFPIPNSVCDFILQRYLPRMDSVVIFSNTAVKIIQGESAEKPKPPKLPPDGLLLNHLIVPPYPSLPKKLSDVTQQYLNKNTLNVVGIKKRQNDYRVTTPISPDGLPAIQSKPYTMQDIASLERRIADLEYYTSLSFTEDRVTALDLKSSVDSTTNRFKFGFFVDNFTTSNFAEITDPAYYAQIFGFELNPKKKQFKLEYSFNQRDANTNRCIRGKKLVLPNREVKIIKQNQATESTTINIAVTETTFTTTGTEITKTTTKVIEINTTDWELKVREQKYKELVSEEKQVKKKVTKQRQVVKDVAGDVKSYRKWWQEPGNGTVLVSFTGSKLGGYVTINRGGQKASGAATLQRKINGVWTNVASGGSGQAIYSYRYNYIASNDTSFRVISSQSGADLEVWGNYSTSTQTTVLENYEEEITVTEGSSSYEPKSQTIYKVDKSTNTTVKEEILPPSTTITEKTTSITKPLFNPKPTALIRMDQLFNLPGSIRSPTVDLLSFIQDDINS